MRTQPTRGLGRRRRTFFIDPDELDHEILRAIASYSSKPDHTKGWLAPLRDRRVAYAEGKLAEAERYKNYMNRNFWKRAIKELKATDYKKTGMLYAMYDYWVESMDEIDTSPEYEGMIVRVETDSHIPKSSRKTMRKHMVPYRTYRIQDGEAIETVRSHWKGAIDTGKLSMRGGQASPRLQVMFMEMAEHWCKSIRFRKFDEEIREDMAQEIRVSLLSNMLKFRPTYGSRAFSYYCSCMHSATYHFLNREMRYLDIKRNWTHETLMLHPEQADEFDDRKERGFNEMEDELLALFDAGDDESTVREV